MLIVEEPTRVIVGFSVSGTTTGAGMRSSSLLHETMIEVIINVDT